MSFCVVLDLSDFPPRPEYLIEMIAAVRRLGSDTVIIEWGDTFPWNWDDSRSPWRYTEHLVAAVDRAAAQSDLRLVVRIPVLGRAEPALISPEYERLRAIPESSAAADPSAVGFDAFVDDVIEDVVGLCPSTWGVLIGDERVPESVAAREDVECRLAGHARRAGLVPVLHRSGESVFLFPASEDGRVSQNGPSVRGGRRARYAACEIGAGTVGGGTRDLQADGIVCVRRGYNDRRASETPAPVFLEDLKGWVMSSGLGPQMGRCSIPGNPEGLRSAVDVFDHAVVSAWKLIRRLHEQLSEMSGEPRLRPAKYLSVRSDSDDLWSAVSELQGMGADVCRVAAESTDATWLRRWIRRSINPVREFAALLAARVDSSFETEFVIPGG